MNLYKHLSIAGVATAALFAGQAFATPTCPAGTQGAPVCISSTSSNSLQDKFDGITYKNKGDAYSNNPTSGLIDVYNDQYTPSSYWEISSSQLSENRLVFEFAAGHQNENSFGIFDPTDPSNRLQIFGATDDTGAVITLQDHGDGDFSIWGPTINDTHVDKNFGADKKFGYYLTTPDGYTFFSDPTLNQDPNGSSVYDSGTPHMVAYEGDGSIYIKDDDSGLNGWFKDEFFLAWEDTLFGDSDLDYSDMVIMVESVHPVPEPAELAILAFGLVLIGSAVGVRRRRSDRS